MLGLSSGLADADLNGAVCCIYHKPRSFDESSASESDDSSSSSEDEEDGDDKSGHEGDDGRARRVGRSHGHGHHHHQEKNAYERIPRARGKAKTNGEYPRCFSGKGLV